MLHLHFPFHLGNRKTHQNKVQLFSLQSQNKLQRLTSSGISLGEQNKNIPQKTEIHSGHTAHQLSVPCREVSSLPNTKLIMQSTSALQSIFWLVKVVRVPPMLGNALIISSICSMHSGAIPMGTASWFVTVCLDGFTAVVRLLLVPDPYMPLVGVAVGCV